MSALITRKIDHDFSELHQRMQWYIDSELLSCACSLVLHGLDVVDHRTFGYMDLESRTPLREDAIYRMYSNTKLITSVAAMMLNERGELELDAPLETYLPEFANMQVLLPNAAAIGETEAAASSMTPRQLLSHSAGLSYGIFEPEALLDGAYLSSGMNPLAGYDPTLAELCSDLAKFPLAYQPGTSWRYSFATDVTARLIEVCSGMAFDEFLQANIFDPLGMVDTDFHVPPEKQDRLVTLYAAADPLDPMKPGLMKADDPHTGTYSTRKRFLSGGGGLASTVKDYLCFVRALINGGEWQGTRLLRAETLELMRTNQLAQGVGVVFPEWSMPGTVFGLGFALRSDLQTDDPAGAQDEYFWGGLAGTHSWMAPTADIAGMCLTQRMPGFWHPFSHEFRQLAYASSR